MHTTIERETEIVMERERERERDMAYYRYLPSAMSSRLSKRKYVAGDG